MKNISNNTLEYANYLLHMHNIGSVKYKEVIADLCAPLYKYFHIVGFKSTAYSYDGNFFFYGNRPKMTDDFIKNQLFLYYRDIPWPKFDTLILPLKKINAFLPKLNKKLDTKVHLKNEDYALCLCENTEYGREQFWFTGHSNNNIKEVFHNERGVLREFIHYFINQTANLRSELMKLNYSHYDYDYSSEENIPLSRECIENSDTPFKFNCNNNSKSFLQDIGVFNTITSTHNLSHREQKILQLTSLGKTSKDIAEDMFISSKTVEAYLVNIKEKLNVKNKVELVSVFSILKHIGFSWAQK
ncbi:helix-turn-helix transcriptional regulator [Thiotrichales bacterium 19S3-7]|nr:helix-turn-helix transcriptional regulator [Thiotrichales bacterium 19S3-7]MCF6802530.1 helix-turn-helix transcriptional regulator [Thiotrichales bacterium 19S3-11]